MLLTLSDKFLSLTTGTQAQDRSRYYQGTHLSHIQLMTICRRDPTRYGCCLLEPNYRNSRFNFRLNYRNLTYTKGL